MCDRERKVFVYTESEQSLNGDLHANFTGRRRLFRRRKTERKSKHKQQNAQLNSEPISLMRAGIRDSHSL